MLFGISRKWLITGLVISFSVAIYQLWFYDPYVEMIETSGRSVGVGETALGIFLTLVIASTLSKIVTKNLSKKVSVVSGGIDHSPRSKMLKPVKVRSGCFPYHSVSVRGRLSTDEAHIHTHGDEK